MNISNFLEELKRRNVIKVATAYAIAGWLIIQVIDTISPQLGFPEWVPPFFTVTVLIGFPLALIFAWAFELTPEGLKKSKEVEITESVTRSTGKKINGIIITVLSMAVIFLLVERVFFAKSSILESAEETIGFETASIAVLPFEDFSIEGDQEYFADGLSEELLNALAKVEELKVAGRTSSFKFKGQNENLTLIGEELKVDHILEGSVRTSGNRIRITAQLIKVEDGFHMWSENFDRELTIENIFDIQEEISKKVMEELKVRLLPQQQEEFDRNPTQDIEAYNAYLAATQLEVTGDLDDLQKAIDKYLEAIRIDPTFAQAYARLASTYGELNWVGNLSLEEMKKLMRENIDQALLIDGNQGYAFKALGDYYYNIDDDEKALETYEKAIEILPGDVEVLDSYHNILHEFNRHPEAHEVLKKAYQIDPLNPHIASEMAGHFIAQERTEEALPILEHVLENYPDFTRAKISKASAVAGLGYGKLDEAFINIFDVYKDDPENVNLMVRLHGLSQSLGFRTFQEYMITKMGELYPNNQYYYFMFSNFYADEQEFEKVEEHIEQGRGVFADRFEKDLDSFRARLLFQKGFEEEAIQLYEETNPHVLEEEIQINNGNEYQDFYGYILYMINSDTPDQDRIDYLTDKVCEYGEERMALSTEDFERKYRSWRVADCHALRGELNDYIKIERQRFFEYKLTGGYYDFFTYSRTAKMFEDEPEFVALREDIMAEVNSMKANVENYLKAEGEWKEEWGEN
ncbi:MAG: tetratricopeptide repeat protein [Balneolaceae bacterium]|nr:tetratricopeptide repeat protein [Balneolaceae bacterium]MBO6545357.1 tetratricopeptide repeat protein [Balneolaceae bacterium]MBO6646753.1 tetratricopeptide repeat protein [Balneolaceae bacterium]